MPYDTAIAIGSGGMGEVFKAWDPELGRWVALKYLRHDDPELVERLQREARAQARVDHPGVCQVYGVGEEDGRPYIAMQYVEGRHLHEAAEGLTLEQKVLIVQQVADAVQAAHAVGLIHRDLKPSNIMVAEGQEGELRPYVLDFGIARELEVAGLTVSGQVLGTPGYLSPEQALGQTATLDRRTDIFSLGVILYELLSGARPFKGDSQVSMLVSLLEDEPVPLRRRAPGVPRDLETVVAACLEKDPDRRYHSARALADDLGRFLNGEPVQVRRRSTLSRLAGRARRHPRVTALAALSVLAVLALVGLVVHERWSVARRVQAAQRFGQEVERVESLARHAFLLPLHDVRPELESVRERMRWIEAEMERLGGAAHGVGHDAVGRGFHALGDADRARQHLEQAWQLGERSPRVASALGLSLAQLYRTALEEAAEVRNAALREDRLAEARRDLADPARAYLERAPGEAEHPEYLAAWLAFAADEPGAALDHLERLHRSDPYFYQGDLLAGAIHRRVYQEAVDSGASETAAAELEAAREAFTAAITVGRSDPKPYEELCALWVQATRIQYFARGGDLGPTRDAALDACGRALVANPDSVTAHLEAGRAHGYWASQEVDSGRDPTAGIEAARSHARRALELDPDNDDAYIQLGVCHRIAANVLAETGGDPRPDLLAAVEAYDRAIRLRPDDHGALTSLATARLHLGADARARGENPSVHFAAAAEAARRATEVEPDLVGAWVNLGIAEGQTGLWLRDTGGDAAPYYASGAEALRRAVEVNPEFYTAHYNLGDMLVEQAEGEVRRGRDPGPLLDEAEALLQVSRERFAGYAAPIFLLAQSAALRAEYERCIGADPTANLARARAAAEAGRAVRDDDPSGLVLASTAPLVEARWRLEGGLDPTPAVELGLGMVRQALAVNPKLVAAWVRCAELELVAARWAVTARGDAEPALERAAQAAAAALDLSSRHAGAHTATAELWRRQAELRAARGEDTAAQVAEGLAAATRAVDADPTRAAAWVERAALEDLAGRPDGAAAARAEATRLDPLLARDAPTALTRAGGKR